MKRVKMAKQGLTKKQQELITDLRHLRARLLLDCDESINEISPKARTPVLEFARDQATRTAVILKYVLMDELLSSVICWHYFGKKRGFPELWKTKRFKSFNYFVLEKLYLLQKLDLVKSIHDIPKWVSSDLIALNDLRNGVAHSFFPQTRRRKPEWKGQSVFTRGGCDRFLDDMQAVSDFFVERFVLGSPEDLGNWPAPPFGQPGIRK
jgi:hypothetical protein